MTVQINWQTLPSGQQILVQAGVYYAVVAWSDVPAAKIHSMAQGYGLEMLVAGAFVTTGAAYVTGTGLWTDGITVNPTNLDSNNGTLQCVRSGARFTTGQ